MLSLFLSIGGVCVQVYLCGQVYLSVFGKMKGDFQGNECLASLLLFPRGVCTAGPLANLLCGFLASGILQLTLIWETGFYYTVLHMSLAW